MPEGMGQDGNSNRFDHELTPEQKAAKEKIADMLRSVEAELGPRSDPEWLGEVELVEGCPAPTKSMLLTEWVVVLAWVDPDTGLTWTTKISSPNLPEHHEQGLLGLYLG